MVFLQEPRGEEGGRVANGVRSEAGLVNKFVGQRQDLAEERISGVLLGHTGDIGPRGKQGELLGGPLCRL
jgi:hypothetical protein